MLRGGCGVVSQMNHHPSDMDDKMEVDICEFKKFNEKCQDDGLWSSYPMPITPPMSPVTCYDSTTDTETDCECHRFQPISPPFPEDKPDDLDHMLTKNKALEKIILKDCMWGYTNDNNNNANSNSNTNNSKHKDNCQQSTVAATSSQSKPIAVPAAQTSSTNGTASTASSSYDGNHKLLGVDPSEVFPQSFFDRLQSLDQAESEPEDDSDVDVVTVDNDSDTFFEEFDSSVYLSPPKTPDSSSDESVTSNSSLGSSSSSNSNSSSLSSPSTSVKSTVLKTNKTSKTAPGSSGTRTHRINLIIPIKINTNPGENQGKIVYCPSSSSSSSTINTTSSNKLQHSSSSNHLKSSKHRIKNRNRHNKSSHRSSSSNNNIDSNGSGGLNDLRLSRASHNVLERRRRNELKSKFYQLRDSLAPPGAKRIEKVPKVTILKNAINLITDLEQESIRKQAEIVEMKQKSNRLKQKLMVLMSRADEDMFS